MPAPLSIDVISDREVRIIRQFDAPRALVFACYTRPELIRRWLLGPPGWTMPRCEMDARVGGKYRYEWRGPAGEFMAIDEDWTGGEAVTTTTFTEAEGTTTITMVVRYANKEAMEGALATGMTEGMEMGFKTLDELLASGELQA
jgi:uncharacterized protein YndB with AHSA1/START domain